MKLGYYVTVLIAVCSILGLVLALYTSAGYHALDRTSENLNNVSLALKDLEHLRGDIPEWVAACRDAVESGDSTLAGAVLLRAQYLRQWVDFLRHSSVAAGTEDKFYGISRDVERLATSVKRSRSDSTYVVGFRHDSLQAALIDNVTSLSGRLVKRAHLDRGTLDERRERFEFVVLISLLFYVGVNVVLWQWIVATVVGPLERLASAADHSLSQGTALEITEAGPREVRRLAHSVGGFVEGLEAKVADRTEDLRRQKVDLARTAEELQRMEKQASLMAKFAELSPEPVLRFNREGDVLMANPAAASCFRTITDSPTDVKLTDLIPGLASIDFTKCIDDGLDFAFSEQIDNRSYHFVIRGVPTLDAGHVYGFDTTAQRKADEEKRELEAQLLQSQRLETIGTLAGGIAHDFNNVLTPILGYSDLALTEVAEGSRLRARLESVIGAATRAKDLVQQILTFGKQSKQKRRPLQLRDVVEDAARLLRATLPSNVSLELVYRSQSCGVFADESQMHQVLMNVGTNAYHAIKPNSGRIVIMTERLDLDGDFCRLYPVLKPGPHVCLSIEDTGKGMDQTTLEHMFEPFYTTKGTREGTGLGLSVVHGVISQHEGVIEVDSERGRGTRFRILLPAIEVEARGESVAARRIARGSGRILFVDDEEDVGLVAEEMLSTLGYTVTVWTDSVRAVEVFRGMPDDFDVVVTDQTMPGMTGDEVVREILDVRSDIPVIVITGYSELVTPLNYRNHGFADYVMKPLNLQDLSGAIQRALDLAPARRVRA